MAKIMNATRQELLPGAGWAHLLGEGQRVPGWPDEDEDAAGDEALGQAQTGLGVARHDGAEGLLAICCISERCCCVACRSSLDTPPVHLTCVHPPSELLPMH